MTRHDDAVRLRHMRDNAREAVALGAGRSRGALDEDRLLELGLVRLVEIVGEAAARITADQADGKKLRVDGTPFFVVNRVPFLGSYADLGARLDGMDGLK